MNGLKSSVCVFVVIVATCHLGLVGCYATITTRDGRDIDGDISRCDTDAVYIMTDDEEVRVPRRDIDDIDHPGNVAMILGLLGALASGMVVNVFVTVYGEDRDDESLSDGEYYAIVIPNASMLVVYLGIAVTGLVMWSNSTSAASAARAPEHATERCSFPIPTTLTDGEDVYLGAGMEWAW